MSEILGDSKGDSATEKYNQQTGNMLFLKSDFYLPKKFALFASLKAL